MNTPKRRGALFAAGLMTIALTATACGSGGGGSSSDEDAGKPVKGGTLNMLGIGDVDYVDPNITYYSAGAELARLFSRSLFTFPAEEGKTTTVVPDIAEEVPTTDNGGISSDGKTYTIKMRPGIKWNTSPARPVTAEDFVRGVKRTCNPIQPFGGTTDFDFLIVGYKKFCDDFSAPYSATGAKPATPAGLSRPPHASGDNGRSHQPAIRHRELPSDCSPRSSSRAGGRVPIPSRSRSLLRRQSP